MYRGGDTSELRQWGHNKFLFRVIQSDAEFSEDVIAQDSVYLRADCAGGSLRVNDGQESMLEYVIADT